MPIYEYQCKKCKHRFEKIHQKFSDSRVKKCPECGGPVEQLLSAPAVQFKGSGFYVTDYVRKGDSGGSDSGSSGAGSSDKESSASKATEKSDSKKADSKSESKPETKSESKTTSKSESKSESKSRKEK